MWTRDQRREVVGGDGVNFYKRHLGDYAKDAGHLSMLEHGAYSLLLDRYYTTEKPIPCRAEAYRVCRARSSQEKAAVDAVLAEFFVTDGEAFLNRRAEEEIARALHQRTVNQEIGKRGGRPKRTESQTEHETDSVPLRNPSQTPDSISQDYNPSRVVVTGSATNAEPPTPPPPFDGKNAEALNGKAVVALASNWELPEQWGLDAEALGFKPAEIVREAEKLRQWATEGRGKGTRRNVKGWRQTWSNWLEKAARDHR